MLKFLGVIAVVALGAVLSKPMGDKMTTQRPEATTEDTSGRLLSLPVPEKCVNSKDYCKRSIDIYILFAIYSFLSTAGVLLGGRTGNIM